MRSILVTGGAGFIGSHLVERLLADGDRVVALDNFDPFYAPETKRRNVEPALASPHYRLVEGDIRDVERVRGLFDEGRFDAVVHLAARAGVRPSIRDPRLYASVNLDGTVSILEACREFSVPTLLFGSSSSVYGNNRKVPFAEDDPVDHPISPYAATKKAGEVLCHAHHHLFGIAISCLRFFTVYGPRQRPEMAIHKFTRALANGEAVERFGDGGSARDYTYVSDIVEGIVRALERTTGYHVWNLGGSRTTTLGELIEKIAAGLRRNAAVRELPTQPGDVDRTWADVSRAKRDLDWEPTVAIDEGLERFLAWYRREHGIADEGSAS